MVTDSVERLEAVAARPLAAVTVVIPCHKDAATIERSVGSAFAQTWLPAEVIVIDDFSDDLETANALSRLREKFPSRLKVVTLDRNLGPSAARNRGWDESTQPFIAFLDADDAWNPHKLEIQLPRMLQADAPPLSGHQQPVSKSDDLSQQIPITSASVTTVGTRRLLFKNVLTTSSVIVRRDLPFRFNQNRRYCEDYELWLKIVFSQGRLEFIHAPLAFMFKASFGETGLSSRLKEMEVAQTSIFREFLAERQIDWITYALVWTWAKIRYMRRIAISQARRRGRAL